MAAAMAGAVDLAAVKARSEPPRARRPRRRRAPTRRPARRARRSSTSPRPRSRPRCSTARSRCRSCSTSGPSGAGPCKQLSPVLERLAAEGGGLVGAGEGRRRRQPGARPGPAGAGHPGRQGGLAGPAGRRVHRRDPRGAGAAVRRPSWSKATTGGAVPGGERPPAEAPRTRGWTPPRPRWSGVTSPLPRRPTRRSWTSSPTTRRPGWRCARCSCSAGPTRPVPTRWPPPTPPRTTSTAQTRAADFLLGTGNVEEAFDRLLDVVRRTAGEDRDQAREHLVELFAVVGDEDPRVGAARRQLTPALF